jgi:hypothetical protein
MDTDLFQKLNRLQELIKKAAKVNVKPQDQISQLTFGPGSSLTLREPENPDAAFYAQIEDLRRRGASVCVLPRKTPQPLEKPPVAAEDPKPQKTATTDKRAKLDVPLEKRIVDEIVRRIDRFIVFCLVVWAVVKAIQWLF